MRNSRLLLGKSGSTDAEKSMISKLKNECGSQFTNKLEGMFKDIELSKDIMASFQQSAKSQEQIVAAVGEDVDLQVNILTAVHWPTYPQEAIKLQPALSQMQDVFKEFYLNKYSGRCLAFRDQLGTCVLKAEFQEEGVGGKPRLKKHELSVSVFQARSLKLTVAFSQSSSYILMAYRVVGARPWC
eukprot:COSAG03_NODE_370_length_8522_cov_167.915232_8_plen_185_part_00